MVLLSEIRIAPQLYPCAPLTSLMNQTSRYITIERKPKTGKATPSAKRSGPPPRNDSDRSHLQAVYFNHALNLLFPFTGHNLGSLNSTHFGNPACGWLYLSHSSQLIRRITWNANIVGPLEDKLDVTNFQDLGTALFGIPTGRMKNIVNKGVGHVQNILQVLWLAKRSPLDLERKKNQKSYLFHFRCQEVALLSF